MGMKKKVNSEAKPKARPAGIIERFNKALLRSVGHRISRWRWVTPNRITWISVLIGGPLAVWAILRGHTILAGVFVLLGSWLDSLDGDVAREQGRSSPEGAILDAVLDRYVDFFVIGAIILTSPIDHLIPGLLALLGITLVPYPRAKTEAEGKSSVSTIGSRDIRNIILVIGLVLGSLFWLLVVLAVVSNLSAIHRFVMACRSHKK